ncbi:dnaJ homolog subfamily C member 30, mitochondrial-like [Daktulosphaira vitifoliae]|uniref:dnaJ homolog subfamily C member 30, mitochondrial-like n=1 Tax=Daktulosphaira vitifoliae TaxID=58002 RepID=UPI0021AA9A10|nr:dnaJ homolog subfamily C member 30, mitochondrial-like [Daktulosphaira vitifoliae]
MWSTFKILNQRTNLVKICYAFKSHYEALELSKNATIKEIKDAYYRLSMIYHPDKNKGCENAAQKFRDITAAYEVLSNTRQRKLYDLGTSKEFNKEHSYTQRPFDQTQSSNQVEKTKISYTSYNFDVWARSHYSKTIQRKHENEQWVKKNKEFDQFRNQQNSLTSVVLIICFGFYCLAFIADLVLHTYSNNDDIESIFEKK